MVLTLRSSTLLFGALGLSLASTSGCNGSSADDGEVSTTVDESESEDGEVTGTETSEESESESEAGDGDGDGDGEGGDLPPTLPELDSVPLTTDEIRVPSHEVEPDSTNLDPRVPDDLQSLLDQGYGDHDFEAGEPIVDRTMDGSAAPAPGASPTRISRFIHLADMQLTDDEAATRTCALDNDAILSSAFRPQEHYGCHILNAVVRTINAVHRDEAIDFVVLGGDNADNAQTNEINWFNQLLDGGYAVACDSGDDNDLVEGENNDPKDPIVSEGLLMPWYWVTGNHDILVQGNFTLAAKETEALGDQAAGGTRDWSMPGGPVVTGDILADEGRALLDEAAVMAVVMASGDGHGITQDVIDSGRADYVFDYDDLRMIVISTAADTGAAEGVYRQGQVDNFLIDALDDAEADAKYAIIVSHHGSTSFGDGSGLGGTMQEDAITPEYFQDLLGQYDNVIMHLGAHSHDHDVQVIAPPGGHAYWQVRTAAIADFPNQMRVVEVHDQDNGFLTISGVAVDYTIDDDPIAADGYARGIVDMTSAWTGNGSGAPTDRNVRLWIAKP